MLLGFALAHVGIVFCPAHPVVIGEAGRALVPVLDEVVGGTVTLRALSPRPGRADPKVRAMLKNAQKLLTGLRGS